ncbi:MAG: right-handed parallel beta-helix repeat-containing protein, partial [Bacteroidota bacterium]
MQRYIYSTLAFLFLLCGTSAGYGQTTYVVSTAGPIFDIGTALGMAVSGDEIIVMNGTYSSVNDRNLNLTGRDILIRSQSGPANCTIDVSMGGRAFIFNSGETSAATIQGFTIINGAANNGAGISISSASSPSIVNCIFQNNNATGVGGAIYATGNGTNPRITNCTFDMNTSGS